MKKEIIVYKIVDSPVGKFVAGATSKGCCVYEFSDRGGLSKIKARVEKRYRLPMVKGTNRHLEKMIKQVGEYFKGKRKKFSLPLDIQGTTFEVLDWLELMKIPYGETCSYGELARRLGKPGAARAVGRANGANYLPIIIPCHRVIEANGNLRGYGGKLWRKEFLLDLEQKNKKPRRAKK
jgi:AraC family transcriptional regulator, regulatory protein of adaptative response / methylated-DNA-[protein]-cysteine methyltransferase